MLVIFFPFLALFVAKKVDCPIILGKKYQYSTAYAYFCIIIWNNNILSKVFIQYLNIGPDIWNLNIASLKMLLNRPPGVHSTIMIFFDNRPTFCDFLILSTQIRIKLITIVNHRDLIGRSNLAQQPFFAKKMQKMFNNSL